MTQDEAEAICEIGMATVHVAIPCFNVNFAFIKANVDRVGSIVPFCRQMANLDGKFVNLARATAAA